MKENLGMRSCPFNKVKDEVFAALNESSLSLKLITYSAMVFTF